MANKHSGACYRSKSVRWKCSWLGCHLKSLDFVKKLDVWVLHELKEIHMTNRMSVCDQFIEKNDPFLKRMITGDEKWIVYNNVSRKRSWNRRGEALERQAKTEIHQKKVMLSMWWEWEGTSLL